MRLLRELLALAGLLAQLAILWFFWNQLPKTIPTHFNGAGTPDAYGDKSTLALLPIITVFEYALLTVFSFFPQSFNYPVKVTDENRSRLQAIAVAMLGWIKAESTCALAYVTWGIIQVTLGRQNGLGWAFLPIFLATLGVTIAWGLVQTRRAAKPISMASGASS